MKNTMKRTVKYLLLFVAVIMMSFVINTETLAAEEYIDGYYTYTVTDGEATIIDVDTSISGDIVIPSTLGGYPVVAIGDEAFAECIYLTGVTIPEGVTTVGYFSFSNCIYVTQVSLPESLTSIGELSFNACLTLKNISLPKNLSYIGRQAFNGCLSLEEITIPEKATYIHDMVFSACISLHKLVINNPTVTFGIDVCTTYMLPNGIPKEQWISEAVNMQEARSKNEENAQDYYDIFALHTTNCSVETPLPDLTIYSYDPSTAKTYAEENGIPFKNISELEEPHTCSFGEWFTETEPTVFSEGVLKRICECGEFETKPIAKLESAVTKDETTNVEITYTEENFETEVSVIVSDEEINANIVFGDEFENYKAFDISLVADGEKVQPKGYVTVKLPIPEGFNADSTVVYYVDDSGNKTKLESTTENGYIVFETNHFSEYVLVDESSRIEPPHVHSYTASITKEATCTENGTTTYTCSCGDSYTESIPALGHKDANGDYNCDNGCGYEYEKPAPEQPEDPSKDCSCNCHKGGFMGFIWKIINFFQKLFKSNQICKCGIKHY